MRIALTLDANCAKDFKGNSLVMPEYQEIVNFREIDEYIATAKMYKDSYKSVRLCSYRVVDRAEPFQSVSRIKHGTLCSQAT